MFHTHPAIALPKVRKELYNYGYLNAENSIYSGWYHPPKIEQVVRKIKKFKVKSFNPVKKY